jgi:hypothetical protein
MKKLFLFAIEYTKLRISVAFGLRRTSFPLYIKWWWQRPGILKPDATKENKTTRERPLAESSGSNEKAD